MKITKWMIFAAANGQLGEFSLFLRDPMIRSFFDDIKDDRILTIKN